MTTDSDYIPSPDGEYKDFQGNMDDMVTANEVAWGIPNLKVLEFNSKSSTYEGQYALANTPATRTKGTIAAHRAGRKVHEKYVRGFVKAYLVGNEAITVQQRTDLGINTGDTTRGERPAITDFPNVVLKAMGGLEVEVECRRPDDQTRPSMHPHADVIEIRSAISSVGPGSASSGAVVFGQGDGPPPANYKQAITVSFSTKAKFIKILDNPEFSGRFLYIYARYKNNSDDTKSGPWSVVAVVRIS